MKLPKQLNTPQIPTPDVRELANELLRAMASESSVRQDSPGAFTTDDLLPKTILQLANHIWRIGSAVESAGSEIPKEVLSVQDVRRITKAVEAARSALEAIGIKVLDRVHQPFNAGLPEQVVSEEPREGITTEQIIRTMRPTIMWNQTMVQRGEIDIAVPITKKAE